MRREIWLYERLDGAGNVGGHLYALLSDEHPTEAMYDHIAEFVEDVYTDGHTFVKVGQQEAFHKIATDQYRYINFSKRAVEQEWRRPVFANRRGSSTRPNFLWRCFQAQLATLMDKKGERKLSI